MKTITVDFRNYKENPAWPRLVCRWFYFQLLFFVAVIFRTQLCQIIVKPNNQIRRTYSKAELNIDFRSEFPWILISQDLYCDRVDGPAIFYDQEKAPKWALGGFSYTFEEWIELTPISDEEKLCLRLKWG